MLRMSLITLWWLAVFFAATTTTQTAGQRCGAGCVDENENCPEWSLQGDCDLNPGYMHSFCHLSCGLCDDYCSLKNTADKEEVPRFCNGFSCQECSILTSPTSCIYRYSESAEKAQNCFTCFPSCLSVIGGDSVTRKCLQQGSFCWTDPLVQNTSVTNNGVCTSCDISELRTPRSCIDLGFSGESFDNCLTCFDECSSLDPSACKQNSDVSFCWALENYETRGACTDCTYVSSPLDCLQPNASLATQESCLDTCFDSCSYTNPCPDGMFCTFHDNAEVEGSMTRVGQCMDCDHFKSSRGMNPLACSSLDLPSKEGEADCAASCFGMLPCSESEPCEAGQFCTLESSFDTNLSNPTEGYCLECRRFEDPLSCFSWNGATEATQQSCGNTCFDACSDTIDCSDSNVGKVRTRFCNFQLNNQSGYCSSCSAFPDIRQCFEGNLGEATPLTSAGQDNCALQCATLRAPVSSPVGSPEYSPVSVIGFDSCSLNLPCAKPGFFCTDPDDGYCTACDDVFSSNNPLDCSNIILTSFGEDRCVRTCFPSATFCPSDSLCDDDRSFCSHQFGTEGACIHCDSVSGLFSPYDCIDKFDFSLDAREKCTDSCFEYCDVNTSCTKGSFCTFLKLDSGTCASCEAHSLQHPLDCSIINGNLNTMEALDSCVSSCFVSCSVNESCDDDQLCFFDGSDTGSCIDCRNNGIRAPPDCFDLSLLNSVESCLDKCFIPCSDDESCPNGFYCQSEGDEGFCVTCDNVGGDPTSCLEIKTLSGDGKDSSQECLSSCFSSCRTDQDCPWDDPGDWDGSCVSALNSSYCAIFPSGEYDGGCKFCPDLSAFSAVRNTVGDSPGNATGNTTGSPSGNTTDSPSGDNTDASSLASRWCPGFCPNDDLLHPLRVLRRFEVTCEELLIVARHGESPTGSADRNCQIAKTMGYVCGCTGNSYGGADSQAKRAALVWLPRCTALLSVLSSLFIVFDVLRDKQKHRKVFGQLMIMLSVFDVLGSASYAFTTLPTPSSDYLYGSEGNEVSCKVQGFFIQIGSIAAYCNVALSVHYLLMLKYGWSERKMKKIARPILFAAPVVIGLAFAFAGIPFYENMLLWCNNGASNWPEVPMITAIVIVTVIMGVLCWHVYKEERASKKWRTTGGDASLRPSLARQALIQSIYYLMAFYMVWPPYLVLQYLWAAGKAYDNYTFLLIAGSLVPMQGFWNMIVYTRPRRVRSRKSSTSTQRWRPTSNLLGFVTVIPFVRSAGSSAKSGNNSSETRSKSKRTSSGEGKIDVLMDENNSSPPAQETAPWEVQMTEENTITETNQKIAPTMTPTENAKATPDGLLPESAVEEYATIFCTPPT